MLLITCPGHPKPSVANNRILGHYSDAIPIRVTGMGDSPMALTWVSGSRDSRHAPTTQEQQSDLRPFLNYAHSAGHLQSAAYVPSMVISCVC